MVAGKAGNVKIFVDSRPRPWASPRNTVFEAFRRCRKACWMVQEVFPAAPVGIEQLKRGNLSRRSGLCEWNRMNLAA